MKRCSARPYEGQEPYIFVSYCHVDRRRVFPIIERLAQKGYRVWYDEGIDPGSEWPEVIAEHLNGCSVCVAFITENSVRSHNCRREINFALLKKKAFISVFTEKTELSPGMELQLAATQSIFRYTYDDDTEAIKVLISAAPFADCLGLPNPGIEISEPSLFDEDSGQFSGTDKRGSFSDEWFRDGKKAQAVPEAGAEAAEDDTELTVAPEQDRKQPQYYLIIDPVTGGAPYERVSIYKPEFTVGRAGCDFIIGGDRELSRKHCTIYIRDNKLSLIDNSKNGTYINGGKIQPGAEVSIIPGDEIAVGGHHLRVEAEE
jgi:hypothetical protein